jgi:hypothetical protein
MAFEPPTWSPTATPVAPADPEVSLGVAMRADLPHQLPNRRPARPLDAGSSLGVAMVGLGESPGVVGGMGGGDTGCTQGKRSVSGV